jgi:hypothetical protein
MVRSFSPDRSQESQRTAKSRNVIDQFFRSPPSANRPTVSEAIATVKRMRFLASGVFFYVVAGRNKSVLPTLSSCRIQFVIFELCAYLRSSFSW